MPNGGGHREAQAAFQNEELKEGIWLAPALALLCKKTKEERTEKSIETLPENWFCKEVGCRRNSTTSVGLTKVNECQACHKE